MTHYYIHDINPIVLQLGGPLAIRWYGLSYLANFIFATLFLRRWSRRGEFVVPEKEVSNFVVLLAFFGVFLGGRLGYVLFYGFRELLDDPLSIIRVWDGGMSSHGGFLGVVFFTLWYAHKNHLHFWNLVDNLACITSLGFLFGRLANFVNGELWGRVTQVRWGVIFPEELGFRYGNYDWTAIRSTIENGILKPRHPSQLYQAVCEGLLVFGIMLLLRRARWSKRPGALSASYLVLYALARITMEFFREPDNGRFLIGWLSKGQFYSILMIICAFAILWWKKLLGKVTTCH